ncbi:hypothetical protein TSUD_335710 [Trifolium subterraneum]|uniref:Uncharacterized protein n=1 Tax=Trifolium subterraneum TaxID=3900 RepID=A0A2Z6MSX6_TRISU|nr:hypothetical protein TSUD_335710 [Trifolium subterraneum]
MKMKISNWRISFGESSQLMGAPAAILAAFIALAGAAWSLDLPDILSFNLINLLDLRWRVYERTKEWIKISGRFKSIKYFFLLCSVYAALAVIPGPSDFFVVKMKVILILGGSAALYFVGLASTRFDKEFCVNSVVLSSISAATLLNIAGPTEYLAGHRHAERHTLPPLRGFSDILFFRSHLW